MTVTAERPQVELFSMMAGGHHPDTQELAIRGSITFGGREIAKGDRVKVQAWVRCDAVTFTDKYNKEGEHESTVRRASLTLEDMEVVEEG